MTELMSASVCVKESIRKINPSRWSRLVYVVGIKRKNNWFSDKEVHITLQQK